MGHKKSTSFKENRARLRQDQYTPLLKELQEESQRRVILQHLIRYGSITQEEAIDRYRVYRLSARIAELRSSADITTIMEDNRGRRGQHAKYFLEVKE